MSLKKSLQLVLSVGFTTLFLWLIFSRIDLSEIRTAFASAQAFWIVGAVAMFCVGYACRIQRWRIMLALDNTALRWQDCAGPFLASVATNNMLPFRAGDILRAFAFNSRLNICAATSVTTLVVERLLDLLMLLSFLGISLTYFSLEASHLLGVGGGVLLGGSGLILVVLLFPTLFKPLVLWFGKRAAALVPRHGETILEQLQKIFHALEYMARGTFMLRLVGWSVLAWMGEGCVFWLTAQALPSIHNHLAAWLALPVGTLATLIPSSPGFVGTFDYFITEAMSALGNSPAASAAYAFLLHGILWLPPTLTGGLYLLLYPTTKAHKA